MIDRKSFFAAIRESMYPRGLTQQQVDGMEDILDAWEESELKDLRWLAYMLATVKLETADTFQPIDEFGKGKGREYGKPDPVTGERYYGRGLVQLTWKENYEKMGKILGVDLVNNPELAKRPDYAAAIMIIGMVRGTFTGKKLGDYFNSETTSWTQARRIINRMDKAELIAGYAMKFYAALKGVTADDPIVTKPPARTTDRVSPTSAAGGAVTGGAAGATAAVEQGASWPTVAVVVIVCAVVAAIAFFVVARLVRRATRGTDPAIKGLADRLSPALATVAHPDHPTNSGVGGEPASDASAGTDGATEDAGEGSTTGSAGGSQESSNNPTHH